MTTRMDLVDSLALLAEVIEPQEEHHLAARAVRDDADIPVLAALLASQADYLVSGDKDLLVLAERHPIISPAAFCSRHAP